MWTQILRVVFLAGLSLQLIATTSKVGTATPVSFRNFFDYSALSSLKPETAAVIVAGLAALVGALAVALVVAPRVSDEPSGFDRVALAYWGQLVTGVNALTGGAAIGVALTQLIAQDSRPAGAAMLVLATSASFVAVISVQRANDRFHGGLVRQAVIELEDACKQLSDELHRNKSRLPAQVESYALPTRRVSRWVRVPLPIIAVFLGWIVVLTLSLITDAGAVGLLDAGEWVVNISISIVVSAIASLFVFPWFWVAQWKLQRTSQERDWSPALWLLALVTPVLYGAAVLFGSTSSLSTRFAAYGVGAVIPAALGGLCAHLGLNERGPWRELRGDVLRDLQSRLNLARKELEKLDRMV